MFVSSSPSMHPGSCTVAVQMLSSIRLICSSRVCKLVAVQVEDETDELLLQEDDMFNVDPNDLPRRLLTDFAIYNSEVQHSPASRTSDMASLDKDAPAYVCVAALG